MKQILWFRRDLRITDSALLHFAKQEVLPIFIFDKNILDGLEKNDKRVTFIYNRVIQLKDELKNIGLDLAIFYGFPKDIIKGLKENFDEVLCSVDFDDYAIKRDLNIEKIIPMKRYVDSFLIEPKTVLKKDGTPYKMFTAFYNSQKYIWKSKRIEYYEHNPRLKCTHFSYEQIPTLKEMGFSSESLPSYLKQTPKELLEEFSNKVSTYEQKRDYFFLDSTSNLSVYLRYGVISVKEVFNFIQSYCEEPVAQGFIRQLFWREFYNTLLYHFPQSQFKNFNEIKISWNNDERDFQKWCKGETGIPVIDAAMRYLNETGLMHNRLRMIVASFLTKNLFIDWRKAEAYFAQKLLDYEASSNIGSWQWSASTGADCAPYFRVFNPYIQSKKFDKDALFIKKVMPFLKDVPSKQLHDINGFDYKKYGYIKPMVDVSLSRKKAISLFKRAKEARNREI